MESEFDNNPPNDMLLLGLRILLRMQAIRGSGRGSSRELSWVVRETGLWQ
jgi:hypothetical protein